MERPNWIKAYIVDVLPCMAVLLYVLAIIYNVALFSMFDIEITYYLSLSEMLLTIIEPLIIIAIVSFLIVLFIFFIAKYFAPALHKDDDKISEALHFYKILDKLHLLIFFRRIENSLKILKGKIKKFVKKNDVAPINFSIIIWFIFCLCVFSFYAFQNNQIDWDFGKNGIALALCGLLFPIVEIFIFSIIILFFPQNKIYKFYIVLFSKTTSLEILISIAIYYIYAIAIFYQSGLKHGDYLLNENKTEFSIKTTDSTSYDGSNYLLISQANSKIFLYDKKTKTNVILNNESVVCLKIKNDKSRVSIIKTFVDQIR